jgi:hypothetical protein
MLARLLAPLDLLALQVPLALRVQLVQLALIQWLLDQLEQLVL